MRIDPELELHTLRETQVSSQTIFDGFILHVRKDTVTLPNGEGASRGDHPAYRRGLRHSGDGEQ